MLETKAVMGILLIDRQGYWREPFALKGAGFDVAALDRYVFPPELGSRADVRDLVVVACTAVTAMEVKFARLMAGHVHYILVLEAALTPDSMRELFLAGAYDVTDMPVKKGRFRDIGRNGPGGLQVRP